MSERGQTERAYPGAGRELASVRATRRSPAMRAAARALLVTLPLSLMPPELLAAPRAPVTGARPDRSRLLASDPAARPYPQASQPESPARLARPAAARPSHAWLVARLALASLRTLLLRLAPEPQAGGGPSSPVTREHTFPAGWTLVAVPLQPSDARAAAVFDELPAPLRVYDSVNGQTVAADEPGFRSVAPGRAFWALVPAPTTVRATGTLVSTAGAQSVPLVTGWNAVSTPWLTAVPWTDARVSVRRGTETRSLSEAASLGWIDAELSVHDPATDTFTAVPPHATPAAQLAPWQGALVFAHAPAELVFSVPPPDTTPPTVSFASPAEGAEIGMPTEVVGSADDPNLLEWTLAYSLGSTSPFLTLASSANPVVNGTLARVDPTLLENGPLRLRLVATDAAGNQAAAERTVLAAGAAKIGLFRVSFRDLDVPVAGVPITVTRTYDSRRRASVGDFGFGWSVEVEAEGRYTNNRKPGDGWQVTGSFLPCQSAQPTRTHVTEIRLSDREFYRFATTMTGLAPVLGGCFATAGFTPIGGYPGNATLQVLGSSEVLFVNASGQFVDPDTFDVFEPADVRLTLPGGRKYDLNLTRGLTRIADASDNSVLIGPGAIVHSSGRTVGITRDAAGRITRITDPAGNAMTYAYGAGGDLESFTDREGGATTFTYSTRHAHLLEAVRDPRGAQGVRNDYDDDGRLVAHTDATGARVEFTHELDDRRETVTDREGHTRVLEYDPSGNVTRETDPLGHTTTRTFDASGNRLTETNALGHTTTSTFDAGDNVTSLRDPLGNTASLTYNARSQPLTTTDPRGSVTTNAYDASGNLLTVRDPLGNLSTNTYDARGHVLTQKDALGHVTAYAYDAFGNLVRETDALGEVTTYTYDANGHRLSQTRTRTTAGGPETLVTTFTYDRMGRLTQVTDADGSVTKTVYDAAGRRTESHDRLGRKTLYAYDDIGRLLRTTHPDGTTEEATYDAEGRQLTAKDRAGRVTRYEYDAVGRLLKTTFPDGSYTLDGYDAAGRLVSVRDARGNVTAYEYDAAGRRTKATDAAGRASTFGYDENGNLVSVTDPASRTTTYEYDDLNRRIRTVFPDGSSSVTTFAGASTRRATEVDQAGKTTQYAYDVLGRLTSITDAAGQVTRHAYDELGNRVATTDGNGNVVRLEYDRAGRVARVLLPDGKAEARAYDLAGNLTSRTDFAGRIVRHAYDAADRLRSTTYPDGSSVVFTYTATGQRASVADAAGTTTLTYDVRDRLQSVTFPDGRSLSHAYDAQGNRTMLTSVIGGVSHATSFAYDVLGRLERVTDPSGRSYAIAYDATGNRASVSHPNGVTTAYAYNALDRLTSLVTRRGGTVLQSYALTLGPAGNRTEVVEADGTRRQYAYDDVYRLTAETVTGATPYAKSFTYDAVGNRLTQTTIGSGAPGTPLAAGTVHYAYDSRDRLSGANGATLSYDDNGNLVASGGGAYAWDFDDRLVRVTTASGAVVEHAYDADGNRVQTRITPPTGPPATTNYLVDGSGSLSHVVAETDAAGALQAYYVRAGDELLAVIRPGGTRFYHTDAVGSVRGLTDEGGQLTDTYTYTAFGELVEHVGGDPQPYAFAGEPLDPNSGFQYHRARWLDPRPGRFISSDPFEGKPFDPASLHRYTYAANDAVGKRDPSGRFFLMDVSIANSIRSTLAGMQANFGFALIAQISEGGSAGLRELVLGAAGGLLLTGAVIFAARLFARLARFGRAVATASKAGKAGEAFDDLAELRRGLGLPAAGSADDGATLARLEIGGDKFYGINAHGQPVTLKVNAISKTHAETDAFQQAFNAGAGGGKARLVVDRDLCAACGQNGAVKSLARQLGVTELEVVTPGGTQIITP